MNARHKYRRLALSLLGGLCAAAFNFSALAAGPKHVSATVSPTTGYTVTGSTFRVPPSATVSPIRDITTYSRYAGGIAQQSRAGITITAIKQTQEVKGRFLFPKQGLKESLKSCLKGRCIAGPAVLAGYAGIQALFDGLDWIMLEGGAIVKEEYSSSDLESGYYLFEGVQYPNARLACEAGGRYYGFAPDVTFKPDPRGSLVYCSPSTPVGGFYVHVVNPVCSDPNMTPPLCETMTQVPVTDPEIDAGVQGGYGPEVSDMPAVVAGQPPEYPEYEITDAPRLVTPPKTTTKYDANGNPVEVQETNIWYDFGLKNNPSKEPEVDITKTEQTQGYGPSGAPTGTTTTVTTEKPPAVRPPEIDIPTDCDFMPTVCAWLDWWKKDWEPDADGPKIEDQKQVIDLRDFEETVVIGPSSAACPAPYELAIPFVNTTVQISYKPFCDLADIIRPLLLALAYFAAAYLTIRSI